jgi:hypothetical protein
LFSGVGRADALAAQALGLGRRGVAALGANTRALAAFLQGGDFGGVGVTRWRRWRLVDGGGGPDAGGFEGLLLGGVVSVTRRRWRRRRRLDGGGHDGGGISGDEDGAQS